MEKILPFERDGIKFELSYTDRPGSGDTIVYLHGLGCAKEDADILIRDQRLTDYRIIAFDYPGFGHSAYPTDQSLTIDDLVDLADSIISQLETSPIHLVGHSVGGLLALKYCERHSQKVRSLINIEGNFVAKDCFFSHEAIGTSLEQFEAQVFPTIKQRVAAKQNAGYRHYAAQLEHIKVKAYFDYSPSVVAYSESGTLLDEFIELSIPKLFIYGSENDHLSYLPYLRDHGIQTVAIANSQHWPMIDNPAGFVTAVEGFLTGISPDVE